MKRQANPTLDVNPAELGIYSDALRAHVAIIKWWSRFAARQLSGDLDDALVPNAHGNKSTPERNVQLSNAFEAMLKAADTFYVHDTIARFIGGSVSGVPDAAVLRCDELPAKCGFVYFSESIEMPCHAPDRHYDPLPADWRERPETLHSGKFHRLRAIAWDTMDYGGVRIGIDPTLAPGETRLMIGDSIVIGSAEPDERGNDPYGVIQGTDGGYVVSKRPEGSEYEGKSLLVQTYVDWSHPITSRAIDPVLPLLRDVYVWNDGNTADSPLSVSEYMAGSGGADDFTDVSPQYVYGAEDMVAPTVGRAISIAFTRKVLLALASFMHQELPAETRMQPNNLTRKQLAGTPYEGRGIRVVHMRKRKPPESYNPKLDGESGRHMNGHWMVRPHPRNQYYRSLGAPTDPAAHRLRWIESYEKGDLSKPLKPSRTLFAVVR